MDPFVKYFVLFMVVATIAVFGLVAYAVISSASPYR